MLQSTNKMFINVTVKTSTREKNVYGYLVFFTDLNDSGLCLEKSRYWSISLVDSLHMV